MAIANDGYTFDIIGVLTGKIMMKNDIVPIILDLTNFLIQNRSSSNVKDGNYLPSMSLLWNFHTDKFLDLLTSFGNPIDNITTQKHHWDYLKISFQVLREIGRNNYIPEPSHDKLLVVNETGGEIPNQKRLTDNYWLINCIPKNIFEQNYEIVKEFYNALLYEIFQMVESDHETIIDDYNLQHKPSIFWHAALMVIFGRDFSEKRPDLELGFLTNLFIIFEELKDLGLDFIEKDIEEFFREEWTAVANLINKPVPEKIGSEEMIAFISLLGIRDVLDSKEQGLDDTFN